MICFEKMGHSREIEHMCDVTWKEMVRSIQFSRIALIITTCIWFFPPQSVYILIYGFTPYTNENEVYNAIYIEFDL